MGAFSFGHLQTLWSVLHIAAQRADELGDDRSIVLVSPWHHNASRAEDGWSGAVLDTLYPHTNGALETLADVLSSLVSLGYEVTVVTLSQHGDALSRDQNFQLDFEIDFFEKLERNGVQCLLVDNMHHKYIRTPFHIVHGTMNLSKNGLFGRTRESMNLFFAEPDEGNFFAQNDGIISDNILTARPYFDRPISVTVLDVARFNPGLQAPVVEDEAIAELAELTDIAVDGEFSPNIPSDFEPVGSAIQHGTPEEVQQVNDFIQLNALVGAIVTAFVEHVRNDRYAALTESALYETFGSIQGISDEGAPPNLTDLVEHIVAFCDDLPPEATMQLRKALGLSEDIPWDRWKASFVRIVNSLPNIYALIGNPDYSRQRLRQRISASLEEANRLLKASI
jgi:hypothetical protein